MEKKGLRKKDILRMDGLLPPTRRLPVCDAVTGTSDKKKDKKWSIGGILRRISSIRDYDSSSNDEEIVYCKKTPRKPTKFNNQSDGVVLHSIENNSDRGKRVRIESNIRHTATGSPSHLRRDSLHSRSSDGSLDGFGKKNRKNKLKARAEAKRDHLCVDSSSEEDCRRSNSSLNRSHIADNSLRNNTSNRKTRAARTERYIKRLSRDDGNGSADTLNDPHHKRFSLEYVEDEQQRAIYADTNGSCRPPVHPRRTFGANSNSRVFPVQKSSVESLQNASCGGLPDVGSFNDFRRYFTGQCVTDLNQNNTYGKISRVSKDAYADTHQAGNFFTYPAKNACHYSEPFDRIVDRQLMISPDHQPPEPPPRDPRYRVFGYGYNSYPANRHHNVPNTYKREDKTNVVNGLSRPDWRNFRSYGSSNEIAQYVTAERELENLPKSNTRLEFRNSLEYINNKYNSSLQCANDAAYKETEAMRCQRRNTRNDQLNCNDTNYSVRMSKNKSVNICEPSKRETIPSYGSAASPDWSSSKRSPCERIISRSITPTYDVDKRVVTNKKEDSRRMTPTEEAMERRRSSKNLEEALSELEAIYNSLRLGDEDLLDRAERRSMEEFSLKQGKIELDAITPVTPDSPDRTKDDMAYRRMHPKERPTSLSNIAGQSTLSNISYLIASPVLLRRDSIDDFAGISSTGCTSRRDEPDVTRDDVVFRSINHANNTLKVIDPQPPFGIPLGPVTAATESDYLHTTPTKPEQPRSSYIPQCEPDVVTDDLAYRTLRKDVGARNTTESKIDVPRERTDSCGMKKKRAVRSLSANLYGLINQDQIHLRREPSLENAIKDETRDVTRNLATTERPEYLRRVVSDGELSDKDAYRQKEAVRRSDIDINGNHSSIGAYRKKLSSVRVSPELTMTTRESPKMEKESSFAGLSDAMLSSGAALHDDEFWHEYLRSDSNASNIDSGRSTEPDFTAYSRLCQDLVDLIKDGDDVPSPPNANADTVAATLPSDKSSDHDVKLEIDEPPISSRSSDTHYSSGSLRVARAEDDKSESPAAFLTNFTEPMLEPTPAKSLDFYLRVADENVKLIAAAFGSVADHLRDSRLSARKSLSTSHGSEVDNQSSSTRSSTLYSQDDASDDQPQSTTTSARLLEEARVASKRSSLTSNEGDQRGSASHYSEQDPLTADTEELDLSRAVRDLQLAAASLYEHGQEIEDLGKGRNGKIGACLRDTTPVAVVSATNKDNEDRSIRKIGLAVTPRERREERSEQEKEEKDKEEEETRVENVAPITTAIEYEHEDKSPFRKINLIADALRQEQERDQEEQVEMQAVMLPGGIATEEDARSDSSREEDREGERTVCELLDDHKSSCRCAMDAKPDGTPCVSYVTNLITRVNAVTTCSMLLLACLLALLLAIAMAS